MTNEEDIHDGYMDEFDKIDSLIWAMFDTEIKGLYWSDFYIGENDYAHHVRSKIHELAYN